MNALLGLIVSPAGRLARAAVGFVIILIGLLVVQGTVGWIIAAVGLVPLGTGVFDVCILAPLAGLPFSGSEVRRLTRP
jgi:hypothetical protein